MSTEPAPIVTAAWQGFVRHDVPGKDGRLSLRIGGPEGGAPVLLCHSILTSSAIWHRQAIALAARGFRVLALDSRGHGQSEAPRGPYTMDDLVADAVAALDHLGIARAHVIGVSQGGMTAFGLGVRHPDRILSLCVIAARADAPPPFAAAWDDRIALVRERGIVPLAAPTADRWCGRAFLEAHPEIATALLGCIGETDPEGFIGCARAIQGLAYLDGVKRLTLPVTMIVGALDQLLVAPTTELAAVLGCRLTVIPDAGHLPQLHRPAEVDAEIERHLREVA
ncbi:3-oxoadipate enol-lactonase 2 [Bradyrhizobium ivorense]|uniref:3-oxoadipate enol-lactonase 2 n=1 Tax=Bradyrhizobium ivorense TaxID=2511166 RepID=A0A508T547_9BRAD|nr:alpha/beta fold hydrolase [Bradyrhizobium ivorense]VIO67539.1 3-oxoadipate enol-lactonase 2 [Bradyrhizobium ivorense]VIO68168.1 3-oxoadipate enol-lactonase 2 [Bradyrhizobium ivorense]